MKNGILFLIAALVLTSTLFAAQSVKGKKGKKGNPEMKKELKAYKSANVTPVLMKAHDKMDASFSKSDFAEIQRLRAESKTLSEKHRAFRKTIKSEMKNAEDRQAIRSKYAPQFEAQRAEKQALATKLKPILERNEVMLKGIMEELKPQREVWKTETRAIMAKYMTVEELEQCKGRMGKHRAGKGSCEGKPGGSSARSFDARQMNRAEGAEGRKRPEGRAGQGKGNRKIVKFVLWDGEAKSKEDNGFDFDRTKRHDRPTLGQNYPNPASSTTTIDFDLPKDMNNLQVLVSDMQGKVVRRYNFENRTAGSQSLELNLRGLPSGTYLYTLEGEGYKETRKMSVAQ